MKQWGGPEVQITPKNHHKTMYSTSKTKQQQNEKSQKQITKQKIR